MSRGIFGPKRESNGNDRHYIMRSFASHIVELMLL
jgi:hypothetical protein